MVQNKFCKRILGVYKSTSNILSRNEIGRVPISLMITLHILKYWIFITSLQKDRLLYQAYMSEKILDENGHSSWVTFVKQLRFKLQDIWDSQSVINRDDLIHKVKRCLFDEYEDV